MFPTRLAHPPQNHYDVRSLRPALVFGPFLKVDVSLLIRFYSDRYNILCHNQHNFSTSYPVGKQNFIKCDCSKPYLMC